MAYTILGISAFFHDSAAVLLVDGNIVAAAQEERFSRIKNDSSYPRQAIAYVLREGGIDENGLSAVAYFEKPLLKFERLLVTYHAFVPRGLPSFLKSMPIWLKEKLFLKKTLRKEMKLLGHGKVPIYFPEHHLSHAASAFYPSPFNKATIITIDGVGEWATMTIGIGEGKNITVLKEQHFPHSLGLLYSAFTYYLGFEVNSGEYKLMGLAAYGLPDDVQTLGFIDKIEAQLVDIRVDGSFILNMDYFRYATALQMTDNNKWKTLFEIPKREPKDELSQSHANLAMAVQKVTETIILKLVENAIEMTKEPNLVLAGGVALNSVANGKIMDLPMVEDLWIQPAAGDAGGALGAAFAVWHLVQNSERSPLASDAMKGAYLGPEYSDSEIAASILKYDQFQSLSIKSNEELIEKTVDVLIEGKVIGWFQGRMEFGPRALGNRSIIADARNPEMQKHLNSKIKFRENFRPFAPIILEEDVNDYFDFNGKSPYMLLVKPVRESRRREFEKTENNRLIERLWKERSDISSVTHVDYSARIQTVNHDSNPMFYQLLKAFKKRTGYGLLINTSFNVKDEPIVCTPSDALRCFNITGMDLMVMGDFMVTKK